MKNSSCVWRKRACLIGGFGSPVNVNVDLPHVDVDSSDVPIPGINCEKSIMFSPHSPLANCQMSLRHRWKRIFATCITCEASKLPATSALLQILPHTPWRRKSLMTFSRSAHSTPEIWGIFSETERKDRPTLFSLCTSIEDTFETRRWRTKNRRKLW